MRLNRFLALCGVASRRKSEEYILRGDVSINDKVVKSLKTMIDPKKDNVLFQGKPLSLPLHFSYFILNKPKGFLSSASDPHHEDTVYSLIDGIEECVFNVGRLDKDSEGLLLFTNDGKLAHRLLHPKYEVSKIYFVVVNGLLTDQNINNLASGIELEEGRTNKAEVELIHCSKEESKIIITVNQGWKRQIRRMIESIGLQVSYLRRDSFGTLSISELQVGKWRKLTLEEVNSVKRLAKLP